MSTNDVPGAKVANNDELAMGCWAEHDDGSMLFVESTESDRVIYSIFDMDKEPIIEYRDAMPERMFKSQFSWNPSNPASVKWTWHDKTPFPWDRVIKAGVADGPRHASAEDTLTAAERVAKSLRLRGRELDEDEIRHRGSDMRSRVDAVMESIRRGIESLMR